MIITTAIFYYAYLLIVLFFIIYSLFNIYHLVRFGFMTLTNMIMIIFYIALSASFIILSFSLLMGLDWNTILLQINF